MGSNPIADMMWLETQWKGRKRKLELSPGVALRSTQVRITPFGWTHGKEGNERNAWSA